MAFFLAFGPGRTGRATFLPRCAAVLRAVLGPSQDARREAQEAAGQARNDRRLYLAGRGLPAGNRMPPAQGPLVFDDVVIDFDGRRLSRGGCEQALEPKAFAVLALLAASPGRVFTRDEILDAIWGHRHVTQSVLNRIMSLLRQALGEDAQHARLLHTVYGVGYRFELPASAATGGAAAVGTVATAADPAPSPSRRSGRWCRTGSWPLPPCGCG